MMCPASFTRRTWYPSTGLPDEPGLMPSRRLDRKMCSISVDPRLSKISMPVRSFVLSSETLARLARVLPPEWTPGNPVDLHISASAELYAAALKVLSEAPEVDGILIIHTPNAMVGGVALNLENAEAVRLAAHGILRRVHESASEARIEGFAVQRMVLWPQVRQLMLGSARDPLFGPVLVFGEGDRAVELVRDHTVALVRLSALLVDHPEIVACDINPLFANH